MPHELTCRSPVSQGHSTVPLELVQHRVSVPLAHSPLPPVRLYVPFFEGHAAPRHVAVRKGELVAVLVPTLADVDELEPESLGVAVDADPSPHDPDVARNADRLYVRGVAVPAAAVTLLPERAAHLAAAACDELEAAGGETLAYGRSRRRRRSCRACSGRLRVNRRHTQHPRLILATAHRPRLATRRAHAIGTDLPRTAPSAA